MRLRREARCDRPRTRRRRREHLRNFVDRRGPPQSKQDVTDVAAEWADEFAATARERGLESEAVVKTGVPAGEIAAYAAELDADMIVIGTAGRTGLEKRILGSVTDKVVRTAPVPVVTVRPVGSIDAA